jgi:hypothetical protein
LVLLTSDDEARAVRELDGCDYITDEPWNYLQTVQTAEDKALRGLILPALIEECRAAACDTGSST